MRFPWWRYYYLEHFWNFSFGIASKDILQTTFKKSHLSVYWSDSTPCHYDLSSLPSCFAFLLLALLSYRLCWSQWPKDAQTGATLAELLEQELLGYTKPSAVEGECHKSQNPVWAACLPGSAVSSLHSSKDWILVISITRGWGNLKYKNIVCIFLHWKYQTIETKPIHTVCPL